MGVTIGSVIKVWRDITAERTRLSWMMMPVSG